MRGVLSKVCFICLTFSATIRFTDFKKILDEEFKKAKPADSLVQYMFESNHLSNNTIGFRKFKFNDNGTDIDRKQDMDILDFLLAMNLLARIVYDKKLRSIYSLFSPIQ